MYVQDALRQNSWLVYKQLIKRGAYVFVCGGSSMAAAVDVALRDIIMKHGSKNQHEAAALFENIKVSFVSNLQRI